MRDLKTECRIAVVQARPVMFDKDKCVRKALGILELADNAACCIFRHEAGRKLNVL